MFTRFLAACLVAACATWPILSHADDVLLRGGNRITGLVLEHKSEVREIRLLTARGEVSILRSQVEAVHKAGTPAERLAEALKTLKQDDVAGRFELAEWCAANGLEAECQEQLRSVLRLDPDHARARRLLGYTRREGKWIRGIDPTKESPVPRTESAESPPPGSVDRAKDPIHAPRVLDDPAGDSRESLANRRARWDREVSRIVKWLESKIENRARQARDQLAEIRDPMAVPALVRALRTGNDDTRSRITTGLGQVSGPEATAALSLVAVADASPTLRWMAIEQLRQRDARDYRSALIAALRSSNRAAIFNAAEAAAELKDVALTPHLVGALMMDSTHTFEVPNLNIHSVILAEAESAAMRA